MDLLEAMTVIVLLVHIQAAKYRDAYSSDWYSEKDWTSHFDPCRHHFMFKFSPCEPKTKMLACCRRFNSFVLFILIDISIAVIAAVPVLMLCCICPPWRVLCECCLCCKCCAIDEDGNFIHFVEEKKEQTEEFNTRTESKMDIVSKM